MQMFPSDSARTVVLAAVFAATLVAGCGGKSKSDAAATDTVAAHTDSAPTATASASGSAPASTSPSTESAQAPLTPADIDRWQRGMDAELKAVRDAGTQLRNAKTGTDTLNAMFAMNETSTRAAGASAAGVDPQRYQFIRTTLSSVVAQMAPLEQEMNTSQMPASAVAAMKQEREQGLARATSGMSPELLNALRPRAAALRQQDLTLAAERVKGAQGGR